MARKVLKRWVDVLTVISLAALFLAVVVNAIEIALRFAVDNSFYWIQDLTLLFMMWFIFPGIVKVVYIKQDILVDLVVSTLKPAVRRVVDIVANLVMLVFLGILTQQSYLLMIYRLGKVVESGIPMSAYTLAIVVCTLSLIAICFENLWDLFLHPEKALGKDVT